MTSQTTASHTYLHTFYVGLSCLILSISSALAQSGAPDAETIEAQKATSRASIEWWNSDYEVDPDTLFAAGYVNYQEPVAASDDEQGVALAQLKSIVADYHKAFPGTQIAFQMQLAEDNRVATHWTFTGVQKGLYEGLEPTNKTVTWSGISIDEYDMDGKISKSWVVWDKFTMFSTLGLIQ
ncbi:MAG: ester cyclase [Pseudomonadota bacterium]